VFAGTVVALAVAAGLHFLLHSRVVPLPANALPLLAAVAILFGIGLADDLRGVRPSLKLLGQTAAACIVCYSGFTITVLRLPPSFNLHLGWLAIPVTVLWLVGVSNAFNLVDGLDGLAGGVGLIALAAIAISAMVLGNSPVRLYAMALAGALAGFVWFNAPPARIFLGDSGSLVVGFLLAYLAGKGATEADGATLSLVPIFALSYPLLDTGIAMLRRALRGDPLSRADGRHIHHQLRKLELSPRQAVGIVYAEAAAVAVLGLSVTFAPPAVTVALAAAGGAVLLFILVYGIRWLDYHEFVDAGSIVASGAGRMRAAIRDTIFVRDIAQVVLLSSTLEAIDTLLATTASLLGFTHVAVGPAGMVAPESGMLTIHRPALWKFEYPVLTSQGKAVHDDFGRAVVLTIWCGALARVRTSNVERMAQILAPALGSWAELTGTWREEVRAPILSPVVARRAVAGPRDALAVFGRRDAEVKVH
jgi:UDP-GlcNAc:undecaprenyl-phosphate GlcNAc-1-phosphate transferase